MGSPIAATDLVGCRVRVWFERRNREYLPPNVEGPVRAVGSDPKGLMLWVQQDLDSRFYPRHELLQAGSGDLIEIVPVEAADGTHR